MSDRRYPFAPLETRARITVARRDDVPVAGVPRIAALLDVAPRQIHRWRQTGITIDQAEQLCGRLRCLPYELWPEMLDEAIAGLEHAEQECAAVDCTERFLPPARGGSKRWPPRFCSDTCRSREKMRRQRGTPPPTRTTCAAAGCGRVFLARARQRYCTSTCRQREKLRRYRAKPEVAAAHREAARRYRAEVRELVAGRQRHTENAEQGRAA